MVYGKSVNAHVRTDNTLIIACSQENFKKENLKEIKANRIFICIICNAHRCYYYTTTVSAIIALVFWSAV